MNMYYMVLDSGYFYYIQAENRKEAINKFCAEHGISADFVKEHCAVKNLGGIKNAKY